MELNIKFQSIKIDLQDNFKFELIPKLNIDGNKYLYLVQIKDRLRYVILYDLSFVDYITNKTYYATVPYYLSDGETNGFRSNLLLPFICIRGDETQYKISVVDNSTNCPIAIYNDKYTSGLVYKLISCNHLDFTNIIDVTNYEEAKHKRILQVLIAKLKNGTDLMSVLPRLTNILDFLLAISVSKLKNINDNYELINKNIDSDDIKLKKQSDNTSIDPLYINKNFISDKKIDKKYTFSDILEDIEIKYPSDKSYGYYYSKPLDLDNFYRNLLIKRFLIWNKELNDIDIIKISYENLVNKQITLNELNILLNICDNNSYSSDSQLNFMNIRFIGNLLFDKIFELMKANQQIKQLFGNIITNNLVCDNDDLKEYMLSKWKSDCEPVKNKLKIFKTNNLSSREYFGILEYHISQLRKLVHDNAFNKLYQDYIDGKNPDFTSDIRYNEYEQIKKDLVFLIDKIPYHYKTELDNIVSSFSDDYFPSLNLLDYNWEIGDSKIVADEITGILDKGVISNNDIKQKYLKYKTKYLKLKKTIN